MSEEVALSIADVLAANAALESQLGQAHADLLLAQADAEMLADAVRAWASTHQPMECEECEDLVTLARTAHPGTPLADEVRAARALVSAARGVLAVAGRILTRGADYIVVDAALHALQDAVKAGGK